ncbi:ornithine decarboxylase [Galendromus occidentalis]|uniref:ornithine decarboxylase n=1 Tax=Galendromus occidentalis TaxID=34638 RepID=A0AAJ6VZS8_9ACAR|nr:ornithine decarboxylase [Galendromus occidentalis]
MSIRLCTSEMSERDYAHQLHLERDLTLDRGFYIVNLNDIKYKVDLWRRSCPRVTPFYAVKCNDDLAVLSVLANLGVNFDCASKAEISKVLSLGVAPSRIIYAHPIKAPSYLKYAKTRGVRKMTFDCVEELQKIADIYPEAQCVLRLKVDDSDSTFKLSLKFGAAEEDCLRCLQEARRLGLEVVGVSFHVGCNNQSPYAYANALNFARRVCDQGEKIGFSMKFLDIGGGYPGYHGFEPIFEKTSNAINAALETNFPKGAGFEIISEPGTFFVSSAFSLCARIIGKKVSQPMEKESPNKTVIQYYVNDSVYKSFNISFFTDACVSPLCLEDDKVSGELCETVIWGNTCDGVDKIKQSCLLPELEVGDWLMFDSLGAYSTTLETPFNGMEAPDKYYMARPEIAEVFNAMKVFNDEEDVAHVHRHFSLSSQARGLRQAA